MMLVESGGDASAIGDGGRAYGILQIHAGVVRDVNERYHSTYEHSDAFAPEKAIRICRLYIERYAPPNATPEVCARIWNGGPHGHQNPATLPYWRKVKTKFCELLIAQNKLRSTHAS